MGALRWPAMLLTTGMAIDQNEHLNMNIVGGNLGIMETSLIPKRFLPDTGVCSATNHKVRWNALALLINDRKDLFV